MLINLQSLTNILGDKVAVIIAGPGTHLFQSGAFIIDAVLSRPVLNGGHLVYGVHKISGRMSLRLLTANSAFGIDRRRIINGLIHEEVAEWHAQLVADGVQLRDGRTFPPLFPRINVLTLALTEMVFGAYGHDPIENVAGNIDTCCLSHRVPLCLLESYPALGAIAYTGICTMGLPR